jgi:replicative DNA helicase
VDHCAGLAAAHFHERFHAALFDAIMTRATAGEIVTPVTLKAWAQGVLGENEGPAYLVSLTSAMVGTRYLQPYAKAIIDCALRRDLIHLAAGLNERAYSEDDGIATVGWTQAGLDAASSACGAMAAVSMRQAAAAALEHAEAAARGDRAATPLMTGIASLDDVWCGLHAGALDIIGARSGGGKSSLALQIARHVAQTDPVALVSLEMRAQDVALFNLASLTGIPADTIRLGRFSNRGAEALLLARRRLDIMPIHIIDTPRIMLPQAVAQLRALKRQHGIKLAIVDHRDLFGRDEGGRDDLIWYRNITQQLKIAAKTLAIPIVLLVQLSRDIERREDKRPKMADMLFSGEQDADTIALMHRTEFATEVSFVKRRFGPTGMVPLAFDGPTLSFSEVTRNWRR